MRINNKQFVIFILCLIIFIILDLACPFKILFGIRCPTCGMSSAWLSVLRGDFVYAFECHKLFLLGPIIAIIISFDFKSEYIKNMIIGFLSICFFVYIMIELV